MNSPLHGRRTELVTLLRPVVEGLGYCWEGLQIQGGDDPVLRVFVDVQNGVTADDCERVSRAIDPLIDELLSDDTRYYLEVSSPGLERQLIEPDDYRRFVGRRARVKLKEMIDGIRRFSGTIEAVGEDDEVTLRLDVETLSVPFESIEEGALAYVLEKGHKKTFRTNNRATKGGRR